MLAHGRLAPFVASALLLASAALWLIGCRPAVREPLRVGLLVWPPYELAFLAEDLGEYEGLDIELVDYRTPAEAMRAYRNGLIDCVALTIDYLAQLLRHDPGHRAVFVIDFSNGGDALVARKEIGSLADLEGRRIGVEASALGAYLLERVLQHASLDPDAIERVAIDIADQERAFRSGRVDAVITYDPTRTRLLESGARVLFDSSEIPGEIVDVLICQQEFLQRRGDDVAGLLRGWLNALDYLELHPRDAAERVAAREGLDPGMFLESLEAMHLPGLEENVELLSREGSSVLTGLRRSVRVQAGLGMLESFEVSPEALDASILGRLVR